MVILTSSAGVQSDLPSFVTSISADGRYVGFGSQASNLAANDTNGITDGFVKDTDTGITTRVTTDSSGPFCPRTLGAFAR